MQVGISSLLSIVEDLFDLVRNHQGVYFRHTSKREADLLGVSGYIRNHRDGHVEGVAVGTDTQLNAL